MGVAGGAGSAQPPVGGGAGAGAAAAAGAGAGKAAGKAAAGGAGLGAWWNGIWSKHAPAVEQQWKSTVTNLQKAKSWSMPGAAGSGGGARHLACRFNKTAAGREGRRRACCMRMACVPAAAGSKQRLPAVAAGDAAAPARAAAQPCAQPAPRRRSPLPPSLRPPPQPRPFAVDVKVDFLNPTIETVKASVAHAWSQLPPPVQQAAPFVGVAAGSGLLVFAIQQRRIHNQVRMQLGSALHVLHCRAIQWCTAAARPLGTAACAPARPPASLPAVLPHGCAAARPGHFPLHRQRRRNPCSVTLLPAAAPQRGA